MQASENLTCARLPHRGVCRFKQKAGSPAWYLGLDFSTFRQLKDLPCFCSTLAFSTFHLGCSPASWHPSQSLASSSCPTATPYSPCPERSSHLAKAKGYYCWSCLLLARGSVISSQRPAGVLDFCSWGWSQQSLPVVSWSLLLFLAE